jgi:hypothetical protein
METTAKTRPSARRKASHIAAMIKAAERTGTRTRLRMKAGTSVKARAPVKTRRPMESAAMAEVTAAEITMMEPLVAELMAI